MPLVVVIHGAFDTAEGMEKITRFSQLADREGFMVLYPNGMGLLGFRQHWNAGHCCGKADNDQVDDVGFVAATIEDVCVRFKVDRNRIYMVGFSNVSKDLNAGSVLVKSWVDCKDNADVALYLIKDWGHVWPGSYFTAALAKGDPLSNFDAAEIIWDFF